MGHSKLHLLLVFGGAFTVGAVFGHGPAAQAAVIEVAPVVIYADDCDGENEADDSICGIVER